MATDLTRRLGRGAGLVGAFGGMLLAVFVAADRPRPASAQDKDDKGKGEYAGKGQKPPAGKPEWVGASVCQSCHRNEKPQDDPLLKQTLGYEFVRMWENKVWAVHDLHSTAYKNLILLYALEGRNDGQSDWEDQDLLTVDLAAERLTEEIVMIEERIAAAAGDIDLTDDRLRLERLVDARRRLTKGRS